MATLELKIPPPVVTLVAGTGMWAVARVTPAFNWAAPVFRGLGVLLAVAGILLAAAGVLVFRRHRTTVNPLKPQESEVVVTSGPFRYTRNPMYLGMALLLAGWCFWLGNALSFLVLPLFMAYLTRYQILPEERILSEKFGQSFADYLRSVRRWL